jgi:MFS family permease
MQRFKAVMTLLAAVAFLLSPMLSSGFNGFTADQFPIPQDDPPVQPAGYAFSIWGLIYLALVAGALFGLLKRVGHPAWDAARWPLIASLVVGAAWIPVANRSVVAATVMIWFMLVTAVIALIAAGKGDRPWLRSPIALYAGWLTAASCVALGLVMAGHGLVGGTTAAILCLVLALAIAVAVQGLRRDAPEYSVAVIWALIGVIVSNLDPLNWAVLGLAAVGIGALGVVAARQYARATPA